MITATTRRCPSCRALVDDGVACSACSRVLVPLLEDWPDGAKRLVTLLKLAGATEFQRTEQEAWERLMSDVIVGRQFGSIIVPRSASPADCYPVLLKLLTAWQRVGSPIDFATIRRIRLEVR